MFAHRNHHTRLELVPDEEHLYRLPPMSAGIVMVEVTEEFVQRDPKTGQIVAIREVAPSDLELELRHSEHLRLPFPRKVITESVFHDDLWRLRIKRKRVAVDPAEASAPRAYHVRAEYPGQLPIVTKEIDASFFHDGFENNYNEQQYIVVRLVSNRIEIDFTDDFKLLHGLQAHAIDTGRVSFPNPAEMTGLRLDIGAAVPNGGGIRPFFAVHAAFPRVEVDVDTPGPDPIDVDLDPELPPFFITARFFLTTAQATNRRGDRIVRMNYTTEVESNLLDLLDFDVHLPDLGDGIRTINVKDELKTTIESELNRMQIRPSTDPRGGTASVFGDHLQPWLVGGRDELIGIGYASAAGEVPRPNGIIEPAAGKVLVHHVGPKPPPSREPVLQDPTHGGSTGPVDDGATALFDVADEDPDPVPGGGATSGTSGGVGPFGGGPRPRRAIGALAKIDHIVVLMQENRSFDQVLGYLSRDKIDASVDGLLPDDDPRHERQVNRFQGRTFRPRLADATDPRRRDPARPGATAWPSFDVDDPCHNHDCVLLQMARDEDGIDMGGFVKDFANAVGETSPNLRLAMDYFDASQLPFYALLAREFAISDRWFCAHVGSTWPNRFVTLTGDLVEGPDGRIDLDNPDLETLIPLATPTILDHLDERGVGWRVFEHNYSFPRLFRKHTFDTCRIVPFDDPDRGFAAALEHGELPPVTFIEPDYIDAPPGNDDHPPADMYDGQLLVERVVKALIDSDVWQRTLLIITYDEHGGFYDHVQPPANAPVLKHQSGKLGPRVPAFFVSPLVDKRKVFFGAGDEGRFFDHTSIGATILRRFAGTEPPPSVSPRMDAARDLREVLTRDAARPDSDFDAIRHFTMPTRPGSAPDTTTRPRIGVPRDPSDDFHWLLAATRLTTGQAPRRSRDRRRRPGMNVGELLRYRGATRDRRRALADPTMIGRGGWQRFVALTAAGGGVIYAVDQQGRLLFYRDRNRDGTGDVAKPSVIGRGGWQVFRSVFSGGDGVIYAVDQQGRLLFYRDRNRDGTGDVAKPSVIGRGGWQVFRSVFSGGDGVIYAVDQQGRLLFYRDRNRDGTGDVAKPSVIGRGGWQVFRSVFSGGDGVIHAVDEQGRLLFYRDRNRDGTGDVAKPSVIGRGGWQRYRFVFSGGQGVIYAVVGGRTDLR